MKIQPIDITHKNFDKKLMGYDTDEVHSFLQLVADEFESLLARKNRLKETLREKELDLIEHRERDQLLKTTITNATKFSERFQADAEREAKIIINDANQRATGIVSEARQRLSEEFQEIESLKKIRIQFQNNLKALAKAHLSMIEDSKSIFPDPTISEKILETPVRENTTMDLSPPPCDEMKL